MLASHLSTLQQLLTPMMNPPFWWVLVLTVSFLFSSPLYRFKLREGWYTLAKLVNTLVYRLGLGNSKQQQEEYKVVALRQFIIQRDSKLKV